MIVRPQAGNQYVVVPVQTSQPSQFVDVSLSDEAAGASMREPGYDPVVAQSETMTIERKTNRLSVDSTDPGGYGVERKTNRASVDSVEPGLYGAAIATPRRSVGSVTSEPGRGDKIPLSVRLEYFYHRHLDTYREVERNRAMYGGRHLVSNVAEYDALRHQVPNVTMMLKPLAPPDLLGSAALFTGAWLWSTALMDWVDLDRSHAMAPLILLYGGAGQLHAAFRGIRARDTVSSVFYGTWGAFFAGIALLLLLRVVWAPLSLIGPGAGTYAMVTRSELGYMSIAVFAITVLLALASFSRDIADSIRLWLLAASSLLLAIGAWVSSDCVFKGAGYLLFFASLASLYRVLSHLVEGTFLRDCIPLGRYTLAYRRSLVKVPIGEPGVTCGQQ